MNRVLGLVQSLERREVLVRSGDDLLIGEVVYGWSRRPRGQDDLTAHVCHVPTARVEQELDDVGRFHIDSDLEPCPIAGLARVQLLVTGVHGGVCWPTNDVCSRHLVSPDIAGRERQPAVNVPDHDHWIMRQLGPVHARVEQRYAVDLHAEGREAVRENLVLGASLER